MKNWFSDAVIYEIYPQSFYDTNGDGLGDLQGIIQKLDYIADMGYTAIWMNPINSSSFRDAGYDVTDFYSVAERYGTNEDFKKLCEESHKRNIKVFFDLVPGHTSIDHPWFKESGKVEKNQYTNRYIWTNSTFDEGPGIAALGERDNKCLLNFFWSQPALNYGYANPDPNNPWELPVTHPDCVAMKEEVKRIMDFWIGLGADGFRVDMCAHLIKGDPNRVATTAFWLEMREYLDTNYPGTVLIAEWDFPDKSIPAGFDLDFYNHETKAYASLFRHEKGRNTTLTHVGDSYFALEGKGNINEYINQIQADWKVIKGKGHVAMITGNHDMPRLAYMRTPEEIKVAMVFLFSVPGVPIVYYGDEIGMDYILGLPSKEGGYNRTGSRTPMQWNNEKNHGFSASDTPYLPTDNREGAPTVEEQLQDETSILHLVKKLIALRKEIPAFYAESDFHVLLNTYPFVFERSAEGKKYYVAMNPSKYTHMYSLPSISKVIMSQNVDINGTELTMKGVSFLIAEA
ncbi:MAG: glycosylase [Oscillospiraceae bacterium]|nr:glycosylase [Oscillospiraceae bacterium]